MTKSITLNNITFYTFCEWMDTLHNLYERENKLANALDVVLEDTAADRYLALVGQVLSPNYERYGGFYEFHKYWSGWESLVTCVITQYIFGVCDKEGVPTQPLNHELRHLYQ